MSDTNLAENIYDAQRDIFDDVNEFEDGKQAGNISEIRNWIRMLNITLNTRINVLDAKIDKAATALNARMDVIEAKIDKVEATTNARMDGIEAKIDKVDAKTNARMDSIEAKIDKVETTTNARMDSIEAKFDNLEEKLNLKIEKVEENLSTAIAGLLDRFDDMKDYQNKWFTVFGILFAATSIVVPITVALIQHYVK